jgi:hypothetical protein
MSIRLPLLSVVLLTAFAVGAAPAQGQREIGAGLRNHDTNAPSMSVPIALRSTIAPIARPSRAMSTCARLGFGCRRRG